MFLCPKATIIDLGSSDLKKKCILSQPNIHCIKIIDRVDFFWQTLNRMYQQHFINSLLSVHMMTWPNGNIFRVDGPLCGIQRSPVNSPDKGNWRGALMFSLICALINHWENNRAAGDLSCHHAHYDVIVMIHLWFLLNNRVIDIVW